jgi:uncharacterized protein (DUF58 family)
MATTDRYVSLRDDDGSGSAATLSGTVVSDLMVLVLVSLALVGAIAHRPFVMALATVVFVVVAVSRMWARLSLVDIHLGCAMSSERVVVGETITLSLIIENRKPLLVPWLQVFLPVPEGLEVQNEGVVLRPYMGGTEVGLVTSLGAYDRVVIDLSIRTRKRGIYRLEPVRLGSGDLFGFYSSRGELYRSMHGLVVYPDTVALTDFSLPPARPMGDERSRDFMSEDHNRPSRLREYRPGDPIKRIDWKATARGRSPFVRIYDPSMSRQIVILLECDTPRLWRWRSRPEMLEAGVVAAASVALHCHDLGSRVGLIANGIPPGLPMHASIPPGRGSAHLRAVMEALAVAQPYGVRSLARVMQDYGPDAIPFGATFLYVTGVYHESTVDFLRVLSRRGYEVVVLNVATTGLREIVDLPVEDLSTVVWQAGETLPLVPDTGVPVIAESARG